jgi:nucleoside-diphosphate-sugar epimerase
MPVIVVGGDTPTGRAILERIAEPDREVRAFVSDEIQAVALRERGVKVALGDVSDDSHIEGAATRCFTAVLITEAARDERERSFAPTEARVLQGWASAVTASDVSRVIWVHDGETPPVKVRETVVVDPADPDVVQKVIDFDEAQVIKS